MQQLFQSAFLQSLGFAIANSLWQTALLWLVYTAVSHLLPLSSAAKYRFAVFAQLVSFVWFVVTIQFYYSQYQELLRTTPLSSTDNIQAVLAGNQGFVSQLLRYIVKAERLLPYVSMAYLLLMLFLSIRWFNGYRQTQQVRKQGLQKIPVDWRLFVKRVAGELGIRKPIRLYLSENIGTPLTIGFLKPIILVPLASINHLSTQQLEAVLLHELAHIKRYDYLVNIILSAVEIGLFFNPFTQMLSKQIHKERENSCDDWVLQFQYQASDYAEALLRIAYLQTSPALAMAATGKKDDLLVRVKRMIGQKENRFNYRRQLLALALVTTILSSIAWLSPARATKDSTAITSVKGKQAVRPNTRTIAVEPMAVKVSNPLFNPVFFLSEPLKAEMQKNLAAAQKEMEAAMQPAEGYRALVESIPSMVSDAMEMTAHAMTDKQQGLDKQLDELSMARRSLEGLLADSLFSPGNMRFEMGDAFNTTLRDLVPGAIAKAEKEMAAGNQRMKNQLNREAGKIKWDSEKVQKDISKAMDEFKRFSFDKFVADFAAPAEKQRNTEDKEGPFRKPMMRTKKGTPPPSPEEPGSAPQFESKLLPDMPVINVGNGRFALNLSPALLSEIASLAELALRSDKEKASPEFQKKMEIKLALIQKALSGTNRLIRTVNREDNIETIDSLMMRLQ